MANPFGRKGRRRRVLNEEMLSASTAHRALRAAESEEDADVAPRYSEAAGVAHHPQVTAFVPRRFGSIALVALAGVLSTAAVLALHWIVAPLAGEYGNGLAAPLELNAAGNVAAWLSAALLLVAAVDCILIYSLRRHRIDDYRGRYRVWLAAALACLLMSMNSVAPVHGLVAAIAAHYIGWTALSGHAVWWLLPGGLPLAWIALRSWLDARESRLAAVALATAFLVYGAGLVSTLAGQPALEPEWQVMYAAGTTLLGPWMLLVGLIAYSRFVVLDAQGLVPVRYPGRRQQAEGAIDQTRDMGHRPISNGRPPGGRQNDSDEDARSKAAQQPSGKNFRPASEPVDRSRWTDGSEPDRDDFGNDDHPRRDRKLSKAERKRLRKLKARNRAA